MHLGFRSKSFFCSFWLLPIGSGCPHIFADPDLDPGSQNLADPRDPDPKHCLKHFYPLFTGITCMENTD